MMHVCGVGVFKVYGLQEESRWWQSWDWVLYVFMWLVVEWGKFNGYGVGWLWGIGKFWV